MKRRRARAGSGTYVCPHCGEVVDTWPDPGGGERQEYIEDCAVCCRPNQITAAYSEDDGEFWVTASPDI
jgi:hypothetical protein